MRRRAPVLLLAALAVLLGAVVGCSSDAGSDGSASTTVPSPEAGSSGASTSTAGDPAQDPTDGSEPAPVERGEPLVALTSSQLCQGIEPAVVADTLGLEVVAVEETIQSTPQCSVRYGFDTGVTSNITVASMRPEDVGDRTGDDAFDHVLELNRSIASGGGVEESTPAAGDRAVRLSGSSLHLGIVATGGHLLTVIVPSGDADGDQVDAFLVAVADAFA